MSRLRRLWRWLSCAEERAALDRIATHCALGIHRDTVESAGGSILNYRCVDCNRTEAKGWIVRGSNKRQSHFQWGPDDA